MPRKPKSGRGGVRAGAGPKPVGDVPRKRYVPIKVADAEYDAVVAAVARVNLRLVADGLPPQTVSGWFREHGLAAALAA